MTVSSDFKDMLCALHEAGVEHLLVGAYAASVHGLIRATGDLDVWIKPDPVNVDRLTQALVNFGAPRRLIDPRHMCVAGSMVQIGLPPHRIDLLTEATGLDFDAARAKARLVDLVGVPTPVLDLEDLITNKRAVGRPQDLADLEILETIHRRVGSHEQNT